MTADTPSTAPRARAAGIVRRWLETGEFPDRLMGSVGDGRALVTELVYGVVRRRRTLEWVLGRFADREPQVRVKAFLLTGLYQLLMMEQAPAFAVVDETVKAAKQDGLQHAAGFINAVLRKTDRSAAAIRRDLAGAPLAVRESHPDELVARWQRVRGETGTERLCRWNNGRPVVALRVFQRRITVPGLLERLRAAGIEAVPHPAAPAAYVMLPRGVAVSDVPGYDEGLFTVQDPSARHAVQLLEPGTAGRILDTCASPGGKTAAIADLQGEDRATEVIALDRHEDRLARLRSTLERLRLSQVQTVRADASEAESLRSALGHRGFDRILLDVPCTNTGVLRRRADARWRFSERRLNELAGLQRRLLDCVSEVLEPGGILVYSTCSLEPEEGTELVASWLQDHEEFKLDREVSTFPPDTDTDGIYAAKLRRC